jgi:hypothetical protein
MFFETAQWLLKVKYCFNEQKDTWLINVKCFFSLTLFEWLINGEGIADPAMGCSPPNKPWLIQPWVGQNLANPWLDPAMG